MNILTYAVEKKIPLFSQINVLKRCNLQCVHCCVGSRVIADMDGEHTAGEHTAGEHTASDELSLPEVCDVLEQLSRAGCLVLTLSGGEVLLRNDLFDIIRYARKLNFAVRIFTNGTLVGKKEREAFRRLHVQEVHVSLYAAESAIHDAITGVPGSWAKSMEAIRRMREEGISVKIKCAIMRQNIGEYRKIYALAMNIGASYSFDPIITARDNGDCDPLKYRIDQDDLRKILHDPSFQNTGKVEGEESATSLLSRMSKENSESVFSRMSDEILCGAGHYICFISPDGDVTPCVQLPISCGNIRNSDFHSIWYHSPEMIRIRQLQTKDVRVCSDCSYLPGCARCPGLALLEDGDLLGPSSAACWMVKARERRE